MPTCGASAGRFLRGWGRVPTHASFVVALSMVGASPTFAATHSSVLISWKYAQATSPAQPEAGAAPAPLNDDNTKGEKTSVPATVVDGEQLQSVLGIEVLSSTGEDMGRVVDIVVDRTGQARAAIIDFGGFLGVGSRKIAVDWRSLQFNPKKAGAIIANLTKDQLRVAPVYKAAEPVVMIGGPSAKP